MSGEPTTGRPVDGDKASTSSDTGTNAVLDVIDPGDAAGTDSISMPDGPCSPTMETGLGGAVLKLGRIAAPIAVTQLLRSSASFVSTVFAGYYLSDVDFAAVATANSFTNLTALSIGAGLASALDSLATQEHGRRKHSPEIFRLLLRSIYLTLLLYLPIGLLYWFCEPILTLLIARELVEATSFFLRYSFFIAVPILIVNCLLKFAQSQCVTQLGVTASIASLLSLFPLMWLLTPGLGVVGVLAAHSLSQLLVLVTTATMCYKHPMLKRTWDDAIRAHCDMESGEEGQETAPHSVWDLVRVLWLESIAACSDREKIVVFMRVGAPTLLATIADSWGFETMSIIAAHLGASAAATWAILMTIYHIGFAPFTGIAGATAVRMGNAIGAGLGRQARMYMFATWVLSGTLAGVLSIVLSLSGGTFYRAIQRNPRVVQSGARLMPLAGVAFFLDAMFYVQQGIFRGCSRNAASLFLVAMGMWGIVVPMSLILCVLNNPIVAVATLPEPSDSAAQAPQRLRDVEGILWSFLVGQAVTAPAQLLYLLLAVDWDHAVSLASPS